jgi:rhodanese-related sulfurtransferase
MNKTTALSLLFFGSVMTATACNKSAEAPAPAAPAPAVAEHKLGELSPAEVDKRRSEKNFFVYDNNRKERYDEGHVPGATWVRPSEVTAAVLPADKSATLVFYCANRSCGACHEAAEAAIKLGYTNVYVMPEGIAGWEAQKLQTDKVS